jgi:hypothetical protein
MNVDQTLWHGFTSPLRLLLLLLLLLLQQCHYCTGGHQLLANCTDREQYHCTCQNLPTSGHEPSEVNKVLL